MTQPKTLFGDGKILSRKARTSCSSALHRVKGGVRGSSETGLVTSRALNREGTLFHLSYNNTYQAIRNKELMVCNLLETEKALALVTSSQFIVDFKLSEHLKRVYPIQI